MRLTRVLHRISYKWILKTMWKNRGFVVQTKTMVPDVLKEKGVEIVDAAEYYFPARKSEWTPSVPGDQQFYEETLQDRKGYKENPILEYNWQTRFYEGHAQALILTKAQPFEGLPEAISRNIGAVQFPNQDELLPQMIMQANVWDPTQEKLPRRLDPTLPGWKFKAEIGIPKKRQIQLLLTNMLRLVKMLSGQYPDVAYSLKSMQDPDILAYYDYQGKHLQIRGPCGDWKTTTNKHLHAFAGQDLIEESKSYELPDIFPVLPTIDLKETHLWNYENYTGFKESFSHAHPHTIYLPNRKYKNTSYRNSHSLMYSFAQALAHAKNIYGSEPQAVLPKPIVTNCIHTNGIYFDFVSFQLNTTDFSSNSGVKNFVWFDNDNYLYQKLLPKRSMLRNTEYQDYDRDVFAKFLAMSTYGLDFSYSWSDLERKEQAEQEAARKLAETNSGS